MYTDDDVDDDETPVSCLENCYTDISGFFHLPLIIMYTCYVNCI